LKKTGDIVIDAHPESFRPEEIGTRLFVNVPDKKEIEVIDVVKRTVSWPVTSAQNNFPMALDEAHHRLFVGCWMPPRLLVFDTETGKEVAAGEIAGSTDDLFYDSRRSRVYVSPARDSWKFSNRKIPITMTGLRVTLRHPAHKPAYSSPNGGNFSLLCKNKVSGAPKSACIRHTEE
jgi:hypothetical protein